MKIYYYAYYCLIISVGADLRVCPGQPQRVAPTGNVLYWTISFSNNLLIIWTILSFYLLVIWTTFSQLVVLTLLMNAMRQFSSNWYHRLVSWKSRFYP